MKDDPIVEEVHQVRQKLLADCGGSLEKLMDHLQAREADDSDRVVSSLAEARRRGEVAA